MIQSIPREYNTIFESDISFMTFVTVFAITNLTKILKFSRLVIDDLIYSSLKLLNLHKEMYYPHLFQLFLLLANIN